jgi:hypothetical protein
MRLLYNGVRTMNIHVLRVPSSFRVLIREKPSSSMGIVRVLLEALDWQFSADAFADAEKLRHWAVPATVLPVLKLRAARAHMQMQTYKHAAWQPFSRGSRTHTCGSLPNWRHSVRVGFIFIYFSGYFLILAGLKASWGRRWKFASLLLVFWCPLRCMGATLVLSKELPVRSILNAAAPAAWHDDSDAVWWRSPWLP